MPTNIIEPEKRLRSSALYSSKIIKAGALIGDTKTLLSHWDVDASVDVKNMTQSDICEYFDRKYQKGKEAVVRQV